MCLTSARAFRKLVALKAKFSGAKELQARVTECLDSLEAKHKVEKNPWNYHDALAKKLSEFCNVPWLAVRFSCTCVSAYQMV
jgi:hypothetical protein